MAKPFYTRAYRQWCNGRNPLKQLFARDASGQRIEHPVAFKASTQLDGKPSLKVLRKASREGYQCCDESDCVVFLEHYYSNGRTFTTHEAWRRFQLAYQGEIEQ